MHHNKLWLHNAVLFGTLISLSVWRLAFGSWGLNLYLLWWWLGAVLGFTFVFADRFVYVYFTHPQETLSKFVRGLVKRGSLAAAVMMLLSDRHAPRQLVMRSVLFLAVWVVIGFLAMTSSVSPFGRGLVFGMGLHLAFDLVTDYLGRAREVSLWFWQIKRPMDKNEITAVVWGFLILFAIIVWLL